MLHFVAGHGVVLESRFAAAGDPMELPVVPGADDIITVQPALAERATGVVTDAGDNAEHAVAMRDGEFVAAEGDFG